MTSQLTGQSKNTTPLSQAQHRQQPDTTEIDDTLEAIEQLQQNLVFALDEKRLKDIDLIPSQSMEATMKKLEKNPDYSILSLDELRLMQKCLLAMGHALMQPQIPSDIQFEHRSSVVQIKLIPRKH